MAKTNERTSPSRRPVRASRMPMALMLLLIVACVLLGFVLKQNTDIVARLNTSELSEPGVVSQDHVTDGFETLREVSVASLRFAYQCRGKVQYVAPAIGGYFSGQASVPYCVGSNRLIATDTVKTSYILATSVSSSAEDAPIFLSTEYVPVLSTESLSLNARRGTVILRYGVTACSYIDNGCGVGMTSDVSVYAFDIATKETRVLVQYPRLGEAVWNRSGTKALFPVVQVGGAGCDDGPIVGYDLLEDTSEPVTDETACEFEDGIGSDVEGNPLPEWGPVFWTSDDAFTAVLLQVDGTVKQVSETF